MAIDLLVVMDNGIAKQIGHPTEIYERPVDEFVANFVGHINFLDGEVTGIQGDRITFHTDCGILTIKRPGFKLSAGDRLRAVIRPESIQLARSDVGIDKAMNILEGIIDSSMFVGSTMRYTILVRDKRVYLDESDPQYKGIFNIGEKVKLILKNRIHMLSV
ncbi:MAG: TOBE domain-containing protein [Desulfuromusa sp.]|nr:TOBE domain-containing protein [Desulfuromusa sp.]